jgi:hypothetical protein
MATKNSFDEKFKNAKDHVAGGKKQSAKRPRGCLENKKPKVNPPALGELCRLDTQALAMRMKTPRTQTQTPGPIRLSYGFPT